MGATQVETEVSLPPKVSLALSSKRASKERLEMKLPRRR